MRRPLIFLALVPLILLGPGCAKLGLKPPSKESMADAVRSACFAKDRATSIAVYVIQALDLAAMAGVQPEWVPTYQIAKAGFFTVNGGLTAACEQFRTGEGVDAGKLIDDLGRLSLDVAQLYQLWQEKVPGARAPGRALPPELEPALADLEAAMAKLERLTRNHRGMVEP